MAFGVGMHTVKCRMREHQNGTQPPNLELRIESVEEEDIRLSALLDADARQKRHVAALQYQEVNRTTTQHSQSGSYSPSASGQYFGKNGRIHLMLISLLNITVCLILLLGLLWAIYFGFAPQRLAPYVFWIAFVASLTWGLISYPFKRVQSITSVVEAIFGICLLFVVASCCGAVAVAVLTGHASDCGSVPMRYCD